MTFREELTDFVYRFVLTYVLAVFLFLEIANFYDPELIGGKNILILLAVSFSFNVIVILYHKIHFYIFPAIFLVVTVFALIIDSEDITIILESKLFKLLIIGFAAFIIFLISDLSVVMNLILSLAAFVYMLLCMFRDTPIHPASCAICVFYIAFSITRYLRNNTTDKSARRVRNYLTFLYPFLIIIPVATFLLPKSEEPLSWNWAKTIYNFAVERINEIGHELSIYFSSSDGTDAISVNFGSGDDMDYDNDSYRDIPVMEVSAENSIPGGTYLNGQYFNTFADGGWKSTLSTDDNYSTLDVLETYYGLVNFDSDSLKSLVKNERLRIKYLDLTTYAVFSPAKVKANFDKEFLNSLTYKNEHLLFNDVKTYGTEYSLGFIRLNYGSRAVLDYMNSDLKDDAEVLERTKSFYFQNQYNGVDLNTLKNYRDYIRKYYTSTPDIRDSVKDWIDSVTKGDKTDYEKLRAVETALSGMVYDLSDGELPDYVQSEGDFLNYFLLEKKKGYCVHYATAFCLIARYMGFPARVVQGYKTPALNSTPIEVLSNFGHSWPEVYFEGKGWIAFEPTPGFASSRYSGWKTMYGKYSDYDESAFTIPEHEIVPEIEEDPEYIEQRTESRASGLLILLIAAIVILSLILLVAARWILSSHKKKHMSDKERYIYEFSRILHILNELKLKRNKEETLSEFSLRCSSEITKITESIDKKNNYKDIWNGNFIDRYESVIYGNTTPDAQEYNRLSGFRVVLLKLLKSYYKRTYFIHRLRILIAG